jgi:hypothetical protein
MRPQEAAPETRPYVYPQHMLENPLLHIVALLC